MYYCSSGGDSLPYDSHPPVAQLVSRSASERGTRAGLLVKERAPPTQTTTRPRRKAFGSALEKSGRLTTGNERVMNEYDIHSSRGSEPVVSLNSLSTRSSVGRAVVLYTIGPWFESRRVDKEFNGYIGLVSGSNPTAGAS